MGGACSAAQPPPPVSPPVPLRARAKQLLNLFEGGAPSAAGDAATALVRAVCDGPVSSALAHTGGVTAAEKAVAEAELTADLLALLLAEEARRVDRGGARGAAGSGDALADGDATCAATSAWLGLLEAKHLGGAAGEDDGQQLAALALALSAERTAAAAAAAAAAALTLPPAAPAPAATTPARTAKSA
jgi:hypothetical protein